MSIRLPDLGTRPPRNADPTGAGILQRIALLAIAAPKRIVAAAALVMVASAIFGLPVTKSLSAGGFTDPGSESVRASEILADKFNHSDLQLLITVTADGGVRSPPRWRWPGKSRPR